MEAEKVHLEKLGVVSEDRAGEFVEHLKTYRKVTIAYSVIASGIVCLLLAYFISHELNRGLVEQQQDLKVEQVDSCIRAGVARNDRYTYAINEEATAVYMAGQENDMEIRKGWTDKAKYERERQRAIRDEAARIGFRLPGSVFNDCKAVVGNHD